MNRLNQTEPATYLENVFFYNIISFYVKHYYENVIFVYAMEP
jgi:hypothetical protein